MSRAIGLGHRNLTVRDAAAKGRQGDALLVHVSPEEWALGAEAAGDDFSINPDTGLAEHFSFGKVLKGVAKAAAALVGGELGGPAGAAAGGLIASKALGDDWQTAISTGALSGLGAWGVQQTGAADSFGGGLSSGSDLLGREGGDANFSGIAKYAAPAIAGVIGLSGLGGSGKSQSTQAAQPSAADDYNTKPFDWQPPLDRTQYAYPGDFSTYGQTSGEHQWFDDVNPQPMSGYAKGGEVGRYDTKLSADQERAFQAWKQRYAPNDSGADYDLRGAFLSGLTPAANGHWPDTFKKPGEPTFSDQSIYAGSQPDAAGHWIDDTIYVPASSHRLDMGFALGGPVRYLADGGRADRDQQGYSGGRASSDNPGGGSASSGGTHGSSTSSFTGPGAGPMSGSGNATVADRGIIDKYKASPQEGIKTDRDFWSAVGNLGQRSNDYMDRGNSTLDNLGNAIAGLFSVGEMDPTKQNLNASINNPNASWGVDPIGLGATIVGTLTGLPLGSIYKGVKKVTGYPGPQIAFDGNQYGNFGFNSSPISQGLGVMSADDMAKAVASGATGSTFGGTPGGSPASLGNDTSRGETALPTGLGALVSNGGSGAGNTAPVSTGTDTGTATDPAAAGRTYIPFTGDYSTYGQQTEHGFFDPINTQMAPVTLASGGPVENYVNDQNDPNAAINDPGQSWNYYVDPGKFGTDRISKQMADDALKSGIFYGNTYEGSPALQRPQTQEDFAAAQTYANQDPITALGFDPSVINLKASDDGSIGKTNGKKTLGNYENGRPQGTWNSFTGKSGTDTVNLPAADIGTGQPVAFSPRVAAHESTHRGLNTIVDAVYGRPGSYLGLGSDGKQPWVDTSKFTDNEKAALDQLKGIVDNKNSNLGENEWLTRMVEARITGDQGSMIGVDGNPAFAGGYKQMTPDDQKRMSWLLDNVESAATKIVAQRHPRGHFAIGGPVRHYDTGGAITGLGDGQTDTIPAMLAPGEHVVDAATVAALGNGNNAEGQRVLQAMKTKVRRKMGLKNPSRPPRKIDAMALAA